MDAHAETPVTVGCDFPECPEREIVLAIAFDRPDDQRNVRMRAYVAAIDVVTSKGWRVHPDLGTALCPHHANPSIVVAL